MHDTPPGRPHGPEPDAGPDDAVVGELRELMERAAAGLAPLPDLTQEAVRLGRRRRVRARAAVAGAVTGVLAIGGVGTVVLGGPGDNASAPVSPAVAPPAVPSATPPEPSPPAATAPVPGAMTDAARKARAAKALTRELGDLIGTVLTAGKAPGEYVGRIDERAFPVTFRVTTEADTLVDCPVQPEPTATCRTAWLPGRIEARVVESGPQLWGGQSVSVSYVYENSTVELAVGPDTETRVSPPVDGDQLLAAAGSPVLLSEGKHEVLEAEKAALAQKAERAENAEETPETAETAADGTDSTAEPSLAPPATAEPSSVEPSSATGPSSNGSTNETGGSPR
ncbi:hypothetical protein OG241_35105 [Streptomyces sp. NBC_01390]|uniref:hypothetical protein n=1 Tax=Streptomyces sp. NBC_01390 TaxID=2903850 RepID=UPI003247013A